MLFTQASNFVLICARAAKAILTERYPKICGVDIGFIIDKAVEFFQYSMCTSNNMVTIIFNNPYSSMFGSSLTYSNNQHSAAIFRRSSHLYKTKPFSSCPPQMAKRPNREGREADVEGDRERGRRRTYANEEEGATAPSLPPPRDSSRRRSSRRAAGYNTPAESPEHHPRGSDSRTDQRDDTRADSRDGPRIDRRDTRAETQVEPRCSTRGSDRSPDTPRQDRADQPRRTTSRRGIDEDEQAPDPEDPFARDQEEQKQDDEAWKAFMKRRRLDQASFRNGVSKKPVGWIVNDWEAWRSAERVRAERMEFRNHPDSRPPPPPPPPSQLEEISPEEDEGVEEDANADDDCVLLSHIRSPIAGHAPTSCKVKAASAAITADIKHRSTREAAAGAIKKAFKTPEVKKTARKTATPLPLSPADPRGKTRYVPLEQPTSSSPSPPPQRRVVASNPDALRDNSSAGDSTEEVLLEEARQGTEKMRRQINEMHSSAEALDREINAARASTLKAHKKMDEPKKKKRSSLPLHPLAALVQRGGALGSDASVASILTFGCCGYHSSAADHVTSANASRGTMVWEFGEGEDRQIVYRDMTEEELDNAPLNPRGKKPAEKNTRGKEDNDPKRDRDDSDEEESDD